jgi:hypothetical protein
MIDDYAYDWSLNDTGRAPPRSGERREPPSRPPRSLRATCSGAPPWGGAASSVDPDTTAPCAPHGAFCTVRQGTRAVRAFLPEERLTATIALREGTN